MKKLIMVMLLMVVSVFGEEPVRKYIMTSQVATFNDSTTLNPTLEPYYVSAKTIIVGRLSKQMLDMVDKTGNYDYEFRFRAIGVIKVDGEIVRVNEIDGVWGELYDALQVLTQIYDRDVVVRNVTMLTEKYSSYDGKNETVRYNFCYDVMCYKPINYLLKDKTTKEGK